MHKTSLVSNKVWKFVFGRSFLFPTERCSSETLTKPNTWLPCWRMSNLPPRSKLWSSIIALYYISQIALIIVRRFQKINTQLLPISVTTSTMSNKKQEQDSLFSIELLHGAARTHRVHRSHPTFTQIQVPGLLCLTNMRSFKREINQRLLAKSILTTQKQSTHFVSLKFLAKNS